MEGCQTEIEVICERSRCALYDILCSGKKKSKQLGGREEGWEGQDTLRADFKKDREGTIDGLTWWEERLTLHWSPRDESHQCLLDERNILVMQVQKARQSNHAVSCWVPILRQSCLKIAILKCNYFKVPNTWPKASFAFSYFRKGFRPLLNPEMEGFCWPPKLWHCIFYFHPIWWFV